MVKIRLARGGAKKRPFYYIVVADERAARDGRSNELVGYYIPIAQGKEVPLTVDLDRVSHWVGVGAQPTEKVRQLIKIAQKQQPAAA